MTRFAKAIVSKPGQERIAPAPFGGHVVVHATAEETGGAVGMWETFTPVGRDPTITRIRKKRNFSALSADSIVSAAAVMNLMLIPVRLS